LEHDGAQQRFIISQEAFSKSFSRGTKAELVKKEHRTMTKPFFIIKSFLRETTAELVKENQRLVDARRPPSQEDDLEEAGRQVCKSITPGRADAAINYRLEMIAATLGPLSTQAVYDPSARSRLNDLIQERYTLMVALGDASI